MLLQANGTFPLEVVQNDKIINLYRQIGVHLIIVTNINGLENQIYIQYSSISIKKTTLIILEILILLL